MVNGLLIKLMLRELKKNWFQYLSMFVITVLAVTLFLGFISNTLTLRRRADLYLKESNLADLVLQTSGMEQEDRDYLEGLSSLKAPVEYRMYSDGEFGKTDGDHASRNTAKIYVFDGQINKPYLTEGEAGVLIDRTVAELYGYRIGDEIEIEFTAYSLSLTFSISGFMHSVEGVNIYANSPVFITEETFQTAFFGTFEYPVSDPMKRAILQTMRNQALILCENVAQTKEEIQDTFAQKPVDNLLFVFDRNSMESVVILDNEVKQSLNMLYIFPVIFFLVSVLVIMSTISRLILRERITIGTMKALGISNGRIIFHYAFMSAAITFFGCVAGAIIGPLIVPAVMTIKYGLIFSLPQMTGTVFSAAWTFGTAFAVCLLSLLIGVWASRSVMKENPAECMRPKQAHYRPRTKKQSSKNAGQSLLALRMAARNIRINRGRSLMTVVGILGCSALLVTSFGIGDTMAASVQNDYGTLFYYDVSSPYVSARQSEFFGALEEMKGNGTVQTYERTKQYVATASSAGVNKDVSVYIIPKDSAMTQMAQTGNILSEITASILGVKEGDTLTFSLGGCVTEYAIDGIVTTSTWNGFFTTEDKFTGCFGSESVWVKTQSPDEVRDALDLANGSQIAKTMADKIAEIENMISSTNAMKYTLMVFAIMLSVVVLYNLSLLNVKERTRDMATLKVLGFTDFRIAGSLIAEIMILTLIGTAIGCLFGYPLMYLVMKLNEMATMAFVYSVSFASYVWSAAVSLGTSMAINLMFGALISKIGMTESLKSVE